MCFIGIKAILKCVTHVTHCVSLLFVVISSKRRRFNFLKRTVFVTASKILSTFELLANFVNSCTNQNTVKLNFFYRPVTIGPLLVRQPM